jgi:hypothetical protein
MTMNSGADSAAHRADSGWSRAAYDQPRNPLADAHLLQSQRRRVRQKSADDIHGDLRFVAVDRP